MTNRQYIIKYLSGLNISDDDVSIILLKGNLDGDAEADTHACDMAIYNRISVVLLAVVQNISEGGYSVSWNMEAVKLFYAALCNELGLENVLVGRPKIRNRSYIW